MIKMFAKNKSKLRVKAQKDEVKSGLVIHLIKGALIALAISLIGILVFAFLLKFLPISDAAIRPINQVIKGVSILLGVFIGLKKCKEMGLVSGLLIGLMYTVIAFIVFSILDGSFNFSFTLLNDILFGGILGGICGIIAVNFKKK